MYRILALDLDGTTLRSDGTISKRTLSALETVRQKGTMIALCSGRSRSTVLPVWKQLGFSTYCVTYNGACIVDPAGEVLSRETMSDEQIRVVLNTAKQLNKCVNYYGEEVIYGKAENEQHKALFGAYAKKTGAVYEFVQSYEGISYRPVKLLVLCEQKEVDKVASEIESAAQGTLKIIREDFFVECLPFGVNKGVGLEKLCNIVGGRLEETVAFGDGQNDVEFLRMAGLGVAMKNAVEDTKKAANRVSAFTEDDDGVAVEVEGMVARNQFIEFLSPQTISE